MQNQPTLDGLGFIDNPLATDIQVKATRKFLKEYFSHNSLNDKAELASKSLLSIAASIDELNRKGRDISRAFDQFNVWLDKLTEIYEAAADPEVSESVAKLLAEFAQ